MKKFILISVMSQALFSLFVFGMNPKALIVVAISSLVEILCCMLLQRYLSVLLYCLMSVLSIADILAFSRQGAGLYGAQFRAVIFDTHSSIGMASESLSSTTLSTWLLIFLFLAMRSIGLWWLYRKPSRSLSMAYVLKATALVTLFCAQVNLCFATTTALPVPFVEQEFSVFSRAISSTAYWVFKKEPVRSPAEILVSMSPENVTHRNFNLVYLETVSYELTSMGSLGINSTPFLNSLYADQRNVSFTNAYANGIYTTASIVQDMWMSPDIDTATPLPGFAKAAGLRSHFITSRNAKWEDFEVAIRPEFETTADLSLISQNGIPPGLLDHVYDPEMLLSEVVKQRIEEKGRLVVWHTAGVHPPFSSDRLENPEKYMSIFPNSPYLARLREFDDHLRELIAKLHTENSFTIIISDHGANHTKDSLRVPMIIMPPSDLTFFEDELVSNLEARKLDIVSTNRAIIFIVEAMGYGRNQLNGFLDSNFERVGRTVFNHPNNVEFYDAQLVKNYIQIGEQDYEWYKSMIQQ